LKQILKSLRLNLLLTIGKNLLCRFLALTTGEPCGAAAIGAGAFSSATSASGDQSATVEPATVTIIPSAKVYSPSGTGISPSAPVILIRVPTAIVSPSKLKLHYHLD
jgi:hypothetical protein